jgi:hypothetical protein
MRQSIQDIILQAKQQPRQGMPSLDDTLGTDALGSKNNETIAGIGKIAESLKALGTKYTEVANNTKWFDDATADLRTTFGLTIKDSAQFYVNLAQLSEEYGVGATKLGAYTKNLRGVIGMYANFTKGISAGVAPLLQTQQLLQNNMGLSADVANKMTTYSALNNTSTANMLDNQQKIATNLTKQFGVQVSLKDVISATSEVSEDLQLQYGRIPGALEVAAIRAKTLGFSMSQLHKTGEGLLNIQSSIGDELEYQLLSGRRLIGDAKSMDKLQGKSLTNAYREATLRGDANEQMSIMNTIVRQEGDTIRNNLFARQQLAKTLGTDEATLARTLAKQKLLTDLGGEALLEMSAEKMGVSIQDLPGFKQLTEQQQKDKLKELEGLNDERSAEQRMADYLESMVSNGIKIANIAAGGNLAQTAEDLATNKMTGLRGLVGTTEMQASMTPANIEVVGKVVLGLNAFGTALQTVTEVLSAIKNPATVGKVGQPIDINAGSVTLVADANPINDGVVAPGSGKILFNGPQGAIRFGDNDYITASTNNPMATGGGGGWSQVVAAIEAQTRALAGGTGASSPINSDYWT